MVEKSREWERSGDVLTPAEYAALQQVLTTGSQTLKVGRFDSGDIKHRIYPEVVDYSLRLKVSHPS